MSSAPMTPPASPKPSLRSRMGSMMRRTSSILLPSSRPSSPAPRRDSQDSKGHSKDSSSEIRNASRTSLDVDTTAVRPSSPPGIPSPIIESPTTPALDGVIKGDDQDATNENGAANAAPVSASPEPEAEPLPSAEDDDEVPELKQPKEVTFADPLEAPSPADVERPTTPFNSPGSEITEPQSQKDEADKHANDGFVPTTATILHITSPSPVSPSVTAEAINQMVSGAPSSSNAFASSPTDLPSTAESNEDPFVDPPIPIVGGFAFENGMPIPVVNSASKVSLIDGEEPVVPVENPQPVKVEVRTGPSVRSQQGRFDFPETDSPVEERNIGETRPLLTSPMQSYTIPIQPPQIDTPNEPAESTRFQHFGWTEHLASPFPSLPPVSSSSPTNSPQPAAQPNQYYYTHRAMNLTTDLPLRRTRALQDLVNYVSAHRAELSVVRKRWSVFDVEGRVAGSRVPGGGAKLEMYIFRPRSEDEDVEEERWLIDHTKREAYVQGGENEGEDEDDMDKSYRYWMFVESHPAHVTMMGHEVAGRVLEVLSWSWTEDVVPSTSSNQKRHGAKKGPFARTECEHLLTLLRDTSNISAVSHNRVIARVMIKTLQWQQANHRPSKPLPTTHFSPESQTLTAAPVPKYKLVASVLLAVVCLGIPFLLSRSYNFDDVEAGTVAGLHQDEAAPSLLISATTCLVAAVVLSGSITFLSLPGLDDISRATTMVSALFSAFAVISTVVAVVRLRYELESYALFFGKEEVMLLSNRSILLSLPVVFLAYSILAFLAGVILYSFFGMTISEGGKHHFADYTKWTALGVLGGLGGIFFATLLVLRR